MITRRNALWLIPLLAILTFPLWKIPLASFLAPRGGYDPQFSKKKPVTHNFTMTAVTLLQSEDGRQTANIRASKARTSERPNEFILDDITADILDDNGGQTIIIAGAGNYYGERKELKLYENVIITNTTDKYTMRSDLLFYDGQKGVIYSPGQTKLLGEGITIDGSSFRHNMNNGVYQVGGRVYCTIEGYQGS